MGFSKFFTGKKNPRGRPMYNEVPISSGGSKRVQSVRQVNKKLFVDWFKTRPELCAPVTIRVNDTIREVEFYDVDGSPLGRNKYLSAKRFWETNQLYKRLKSYQYDRVITGSGFLWKGSAVNQRGVKKDEYFNELKDVSVRLSKDKLGEEVKTRLVETVSNKLFLRAIDEDVRKVRVVDYVPSSTVVIEHDLYDVLRYVQVFASHTEEFSPEEIIHTRFMDVDGKVDGFTPVMGLGFEMVLSWAIKENMLGYFRNGAVTGKFIVLPDEVSNSENFSWLKSELMNQGILENRHGHLLLTGNVNIHDMEEKLKDMEYEKLFLQIKSTVANSILVPLSRLDNYDSKAGSDAGGLADSGYWSSVESDQRVIEMDLNSQLFNELGFSIKFKRPYKIDEVREAQAANQNIAFILQANKGLQGSYQKRLKEESYLSLISGNSREISVSDIEEIPEELKALPVEKNSLLNQSFMKDKEVLPNKGGQNEAEKKKAATENNPKKSSQSGF